MKRRTQFVTLLGVGSALLMSSAAHAQGYPGGGSYPGGSGGYPGGSSGGGYPGGSGGASGGATDAGAVSSSSTTTDTTLTTTTTPDTPPNTGGEPLLMSLFGSLTAGSALFLRRKLR